MATRTLTVKLVGDHKNLDRAFGAAGRSAQAFGRVAAGAIAGVGLAAGGLAVKAVSDFAGFERGMNEVFTLMPGISGAAMGEMEQQVKDLSAEMGVLPDKVVPALYQAISAGVPADNVFKFLETAQMAAVGGVTELETAVDGISSVVNAYGSDVVSSAEASDLMFTAVRLGKTNFEELSASLFNVTPTAAALGVSFGDVTAGLAAMTAQGVPTSVATTQMRQMLVELSKSGGKAATAFEDMAGKSFQDFIDSGGDVAGALDVMIDAADESGLSLQDMFGSVEAGAAALALTQGDGFLDALDQMADSAGSTAAAYDQMDQGVTRSLEKLQAKFSVVMLDIGEVLAPVAIAALDALMAAFDKVWPVVERVVAAFGDGGLGGALGEAARIFGEMWPTIEAKLVEMAANLWSWIGEQVPILGAKLLEWGLQLWAWVQPQIGPLLEQLAILVGAAWIWIVAQAPRLLDALLTWQDQFIAWIEPSIPGILEGLGRVLAAITEWVIFDALPELVVALAVMSASIAAYSITALFQAGLNLVSGLWAGIEAKWGDFKSWAMGKVGEVASWFTGGWLIDSPSKLFHGYGENLMEGLALGVDHSYNAKVRPAMGSVVDGVASGFAGGRSGATSLPGPGGMMTVVVELDGREIARSVERVSEIDGGLRIKTRAGG